MVKLTIDNIIMKIMPAVSFVKIFCFDVLFFPKNEATFLKLESCVVRLYGVSPNEIL